MPDSDPLTLRQGLFSRLPLVMKLLVPFLLLELVIGYLGVGLLQHDLTSRARAAIDEDLAGRFFEARSVVHDRQLYLAEASDLVANLQGMGQAVQSKDAHAARQLAASVLAVKGDVIRLAVTDLRGIALMEVTRTAKGAPPTTASGARWSAVPAVRSVLRSASLQRQAGVVRVGGQTLLVMAERICAPGASCVGVGAAITALPIQSAVTLDPETSLNVALYDQAGRLLYPTEERQRRTWPAPPALGGDQRVRRVEGSGSTQVGAVYGPVAFEGGGGGIIAVRRSTAFAYASARHTRNQFALILLAAMLSTVVIGSLLARWFLRQVRSTVQAVGAIGEGELSARAAITTDDELGDLARGVNTMASQLERSYETLEQRVIERTEQVRQLLEQRSSFFAALSHELRTPLAIILAQSEMLLEEKVVDPGHVHDASETMRASAQQLLDVVNQILEFARAEAGGAPVELQPVAVADVVGELQSTLQGLTKAAKQKTKVHLPVDLPDALADPHALRTVLLNLVGNAVKYTPSGGSVEIRAHSESDRVVIEVADSGVGIPAGLGDQIFQPFARVKGTRTQRGEASTGLGLAVVRTLVEAQDGRIDYTSEPGQGTTFVVSLPCARAVRPEEELSTAQAG